MSKLKKISKRFYVFIVLAAFYTPLLVGTIYSFSSEAKKGDMSYIFNYDGVGWSQL